MPTIVQYPCWEYATNAAFPAFNRVAYVIVGDSCYFSGIESENRVPTSSAAGLIIRAIVAKEQTPRKYMRFFDLQTHCGYPYKKPGEIELFRLRIEAATGRREIDFEANQDVMAQGLPMADYLKDFSITGWLPCRCPAYVLDLFREYIG
jgi:hypothetical protein